MFKSVYGSLESHSLQLDIHQLSCGVSSLRWPLLEHLEKEWSSVALQTGWKLEPLLCFEDALTHGPALAHPPNPNNLMAIDESSIPTPTPQVLTNSPTPTCCPTVATVHGSGETSPVLPKTLTCSHPVAISQVAGKTIPTLTNNSSSQNN